MPQPESFAKCTCQHCGGHIEFPIHGAGQKIPCPHCGKLTLLLASQQPQTEAVGRPDARRRTYLAIGIAAGLLLAAGGARIYFNYGKSRPAPMAGGKEPTRPALPGQQDSGHGPSTAAHDVASNSVPPRKPKPPADPWHGLKPGKVTLENMGEGHLIYAVGMLTNETARQRFGVKVELEVLDEHRNTLGTATDYTEVIEPGKAWKFRALVTAKTANSAKLIKVKEQD